MASFETEFIEAARAHLGKPAILHQRYVGNCIEGASEACLNVGIGPEEFDCSGLIISARCQATGEDMSSWPLNLRHVRDLWTAAEAGQDGLTLGEAKVGSLVVTPRFYKIDKVTQMIPGHIGIVTKVGDDETRFIRANVSAGRVEEGPLTESDLVLGFILIGT